VRPLALGGIVFVALSVGFRLDAVAALVVGSLTIMSVRLAEQRTHRHIS